jgi:Predicted pyridoxal phosphate-dependent enzyme apparently involved in regulation of cell wall biogenesis
VGNRIQRCLGLGQFENINSVFIEKERIYKRYTNNLKNIKGINIPAIRSWATRYIMWVYNLYLDNSFPISRDQLTKHLKEKNIETRDAFVPINKQKILVDKYKIFKEEDCPNANYIMENGFYLPSGNNITNDEIDFICDEIKKISKN